MSVHETLCKVMMTLPHADGRLVDGVRDLIVGARGPNRLVLLAFPPKVAGTFLRSAVVDLLSENYSSFLTRGSYANSDHARDLYLPSLLEVHTTRRPRPVSAVMHLHLYPGRHVTELIEAFAMPVVIMTRDILDCLKSGIDANAGPAGGEVIDDALISDGRPYDAMPPADRRHSVVHNVSLWYARFYAQWLRYDRECQTQTKPAPLWLRYDDFRHDPVAVLARTLRHVDPAHDYTADQAAAAVARATEKKAELRFNQGTAGRGGLHFTAGEQRTIYDIMARAGEDDLLRLGVLKPIPDLDG